MILTRPISREERLRTHLEAVGLLARVEAIVAMHPGVSLDDVLGTGRPRPVSEARSHVVYELYDVLGSYPAVGRALGIDHTSAMYARARWGQTVGDASLPQTEIWRKAERRCA